MASSASVRAGRAHVVFWLDQNPLKRGLSVAERFMRQWGAKIQNIGRQAFTFGAGGLAALVLPTQRMMAFDDAIRAAAATTDDAAGSLATFRDIALDVAKTSGFSATEVANMMTELARAGHTDPTAIRTMTSAVLALSKATGTDATRSAEIMISTLNQYKLGASEAARVSNLLTMAANMTSTSVDQLGEAMSYAGPVTAKLGISLEDVFAILGQLGNIGVQGSNAGTALRRMATMTAAEAEKMKEIFGVSFVNADGSMRNLVQAMGEVGRAMDALPESTKISKYNEAFGLLGITAAVEMSSSAQSIEELSAALKSGADAAGDAAKFMEAGPGGVWRRMMGAIDATMIGIGDKLGPTLERFGTWVGETAVQVGNWISQNEGMIVSAVKLFGALAVGGVVLIGIGKIFAALSVAATILGGIITALTTPWIAIPALAAGIVGGLLYMNGAFDQLGATLVGTFGGAWDVIVSKVGSGDLAGAMRFAWELTKLTWDLGVAYLKQGWGAFSDWLSRGVQQTGALVSEMWGVLWDSFTSIASYAWAAIKDTLQAVVDWGNRLVGRNVPNRKSNVAQVSEANAARAEARAAENMAVAAELDAMIKAGQQDRQSEVDAQLAKIDQLIKTEKEKMDKPVEVIPPAGQSLNGLASLPAPERKLAATIQQGTTQAQNATAGFVEAIDKNSIEGQRAIYEMLDQSGKKDTVQAIESLETNLVDTLEDEFDKTRRQDSKAPRIQGSRRG